MHGFTPSPVSRKGAQGEEASRNNHRCKKGFFYVFSVFLFSRRFYLKKRWQNSERQAD